MESKFLYLYKVTWGHTAATYVAAQTHDKEAIKKAVRESDDRCDDIKGIEKVYLPAFDGDDTREAGFVHLFLRNPVAL